MATPAQRTTRAQKAPRDVLRMWPAHIYLSQETIQPSSVSVYDADTHAMLDRVFEVTTRTRRGESIAVVTMSKYVPDLLAISLDDPMSELSDQGIVVDSREYPIAHATLDLGG